MWPWRGRQRNRRPSLPPIPVAADTVQLILRVRVTPLGVTEDDDERCSSVLPSAMKCPSAREAAPPQRAGVEKFTLPYFVGGEGAVLRKKAHTQF